ncbi:23570_t:CDS:2, partial [Gigaspora rosea]
MRNNIWEEWLKFIDKGFHIQGKKVLLLVDNAASHITSGTNNAEDQDDDNAEELSSENDSAEENEDQQEPQGNPQERSRGRSRGRSQGSQRSNSTLRALIEIFTVPLIIRGATKIMPETSEPNESESDNEFQNETTNVNDAIMLLEDLSAETNPIVQELSDNIEEYIEMIDQPAATEDVLTDEGVRESYKISRRSRQWKRIQREW